VKKQIPEQAVIQYFNPPTNKPEADEQDNQK